MGTSSHFITPCSTLLVISWLQPSLYLVNITSLVIPCPSRPLAIFFRRALPSLHGARALDTLGRARLGKRGRARKRAATGNPESRDMVARAVALSGVHSL